MNTLTQYQTKRIRQNINKFYQSASPSQRASGKAWYDHYHDWCLAWAEHFGIDPHIFAGVLSALSPNNKFKRNQQDAINLTEAVLQGLPWDELPAVCTYHSNKRKAIEIIEKQLVNFGGPKTHAFVQNIAELDPERVTIDIWHWRVVNHGFRDPLKSLTLPRYRAIERITIEEAEKLGLAGFELQAIVWESIRGSVTVKK